MIDGIKISCDYLNPLQWREHPALTYFPKVNEKTGEIPQDQALAASCDGLKFKLKPSPSKPDIIYKSVEGSLHRFASNGEPNCTDFNYRELLASIKRLADQFGVIPEKSNLQRLEFGVNLKVPTTAAAWLSGIICLPTNEFAHLNAKRPKLGWICKKSDYSIKIYDKGKQAETAIRNLVRIELVVHKMRWLDRAGIKTLNHLTDLSKLAILGDVLAEQFGKVIYYSGGIDLGQLNQRQRLKLEQFTNPRRWVEVERRKRHKIALAWDKFQIRHGANRAKQYALLALNDKVAELLESPKTPQKGGDVFTDISPLHAAEEKVTFSPLVWTVNTSPTRVDKEGIIPPHPNRRFSTNSVVDPLRTLDRCCLECGRSIHQQKASSKFCSEKSYGSTARKCRDRSARRARTARERVTREQEEKTLAMLSRGYPRFSVRVTIQPGLKKPTDWRDIPHRIFAQPHVVTAYPLDGDPVQLTGSRAKKFVRFLTEQQQKRNK